MSKVKRQKKFGAGYGAVLLCLLLFLLASGCGVDAEQQVRENLPQITVGMSSYEPYAFMNDEGTLVGVNVDLVTEAFHRIGYEPVFKKIIWEEREKRMADGSIDCMWCCLMLQENMDDGSYQWTGPSLYSRQMFVVRTDSEIYTVSDLEESCVAVQAGTEPEMLLLQSDKINPRLVYTYPSMDEVYASLRKGYVDAICGYENVVKKFVETTPTEYRLLDESLCTTALGAAFSKRVDASVVSAVDAVLADMLTDGTTKAIVEKYGLHWVDTES